MTMTLSYIEGWHAIAEANRIFGFDAWDRQTVSIKCVSEGAWQGRYRCSYIARVRICVRAEETVICREGCGSGHGNDMTPGEAHESAIKEAETDAMKRALMTFGNLFGLALYDKEQNGVRGRVRAGRQRASTGRPISWIVLSAEGQPIHRHEAPVDFCKSMREILQAANTDERLKAFWDRNAAATQMLRANLPDLKTEAGEHYADILLKFYRRRCRALNLDDKSDSAGRQRSKNGAPVDKSVLAIGAPRRIRDKEHLKFVASQPCLVCERLPAQAHHLRFAQPRAIGRKVSDEWTVPLCATHHRALHEVGDEKIWWKECDIEPIGQAERLWRQGNTEETHLHGEANSSPSRAAS